MPSEADEGSEHPASPEALSELTLDELLPYAWRLLAAGAAQSRAPFHTPVLATVSGYGPTQRTVVLRKVVAAQRLLLCHTDRRSAKIAELEGSAQASWLFYDHDRKLQLRAAGAISVHTDDDIADDAWARSTVRSRACYAASDAPGGEVERPPDAPRPPLDDETFARDNFAALGCTLSFLEWLYLCGPGHRRARFVWRDDILHTATWIAP